MKKLFSDTLRQIWRAIRWLHCSCSLRYIVESPQRQQNTERDPMQEPITAVIFDMDGTLIDSPQQWQNYTADFFAAKIPHWRSEYAREVTGIGMQDVFTVLTEKYQAKLTKCEFDEFCQRAGEQIYRHHIQLFPGAREFLDQVREDGLATALASSSPASWVDIVVDRFSLASSFDAIITADHVEKCKPAPDIFVKAAQLLGKSPGQCLVIEDSLQGITAANKAGMRCLALAQSLSLEDLREADQVAESFAAISWQWCRMTFASMPAGF